MAAIGIEIEILLSLKEGDEELNKRLDIYEFADWFMKIYNYWADSKFKMHADIGGINEDFEENDEWILTDDETLEVNDSSVQCKTLFLSLHRFAHYLQGLLSLFRPFSPMAIKCGVMKFECSLTA
jgi:hypothetical protein